MPTAWWLKVTKATEQKASNWKTSDRGVRTSHDEAMPAIPTATKAGAR
jgi:hypothetical protein